MRRQTSGLALLSPLLSLVFLAACAATNPPEGAEQPQSSSPAPPPAASKAGLRGKILGEWRAMPPPREARLLQITELVFADPEDPAAFEKIAPTERERESYQNLRRARIEQPNLPELAALRKKAAELDSIRVTFTATTLVTTSPSGTSLEHYIVEEEIGDQLILKVEGEGRAERRRSIFRFLDANHIVLTTTYPQVPLSRVGAPDDLPSAPVSSSFSSAPSVGVAPAAPGMPEKTGDAQFDKAVADYFACVAQMPPVSQDAMKDSLDLVRRAMQQAAKDPQGRRSFTEVCNSTVQTIKASGLCR